MTRAATALMLLLASYAAGASVFSYAPLSLREQLDRADHAVHVRILEVDRPGDFDRNQQPMGSCGVHYKVRIVQQFKGALPQTTWFVTHQILYPQRPLSPGEEVLVLLRDLSKLRQEDPWSAELARIRTQLKGCHANASDLYAAHFEQNVFSFLRRESAKGSALWLEYSEMTLLPASMRAHANRWREECAVPKDGSACPEHRAVSWPAVQQALRSWAGNRSSGAL